MDIATILKNFADLRTSGPTLLAAVNAYLTQAGINPLPDWTSWVLTGVAVLYLTLFVKSDKKK